MIPISKVAAAFGLSVSAVRYYDDIGLAPATARKARIRYYDHYALRRLAYAQLLLHEGQFGISQTARILESSRSSREVLFADLQRDIEQRIHGLKVALDMLRHIGECQEDDFNNCPLMSAYLDTAVNDALDMNSATRGIRGRFASWPRFRDGVHRLMGQD